MGENRIDPGRPSARSILRTIGPMVGLAGLGCLIAGGVHLFSAIGEHELPNLPWYLVAGIVLLLLGAVMTHAAFAGSDTRGAAEELREEIGTVADAIEESERRGGAGSPSQATVQCYECGTANPAEAGVCKQCGQALVKSRMCPNCGELNDPHAKFCQSCCHVFK